MLLKSNVDNTTIASNKYNFKKTKDLLFFSLYFPLLQINNVFFDLIEAKPVEKLILNY